MPDREGNGRPPGEQEPVESLEKTEPTYDAARLRWLLGEPAFIYKAFDVLRGSSPDDKEKITTNPEFKEAAKHGAARILSSGGIETAERLITAFHLDIADTEIQAGAAKGLILFIKNFGPNWYTAGHIHEIRRYVASDRVWADDVQNELKDTLLGLINLDDTGKYFSLIQDLLRVLPATPEVLAAPEIQELARTQIATHLRNGWDSKAFEVSKEFGVPKEEFNRLLVSAVGERLQDGSLTKARNLFIGTGSEHMSENPDLVEAAKSGVLKNIALGDIDGGKELIATLKLKKDILATPEAQEAGKKGLARLLSKGVIRPIDTIRQLVDLPDSALQDPEVQNGAWSWVYSQLKQRATLTMVSWVEQMKLLTHERTEKETEALHGALRYEIWENHQNVIEEMKRVLGIADEEVRAVAEDTLVMQLERGNVHFVHTKNNFNVPEDIFSDEKTQQAAEKGFSLAIQSGYMDDAAVIEDRCMLSAETVQRIVQEAIIADLTYKPRMPTAAINIAEYYKGDLKEFLQTEQVQQQAEKCLRFLLRDNALDRAVELASSFGIAPDKQREVAVDGVGWWLRSGIMVRAMEIKNKFGLSSNVFSSPEMAENAKTGLGEAMANGNEDAAAAIEFACAIKTEVVKEAAGTSLIFAMQQGYMDRARGINDVFEPAIEKIAPHDVPFGILFKLPSEPGFEKLYAQDPWRGAVDRLLKLQSRAAKAEHDPWLTDMKPLVNALIAAQVIDREKPEDAELLVEFVKMFGMYNLPRMAELFVALKRGADFASLPTDAQEQLRLIVGKKAERMKGEQLVNELRRFRREMQSELLADTVPDGMETAVGAEIFAGLKGDTQWKRGDAPQHIVSTWRATMEKSPEAAKLPEGYRERTLKVPLVNRNEVAERPDIIKDRKEKTAKLLARKVGDNPTELGGHFTLLEDATADLRTDRKTWWEGRKTILVKELSFKDSGLEKALAEREQALIEKKTPPEKIAKILGGVRAGYTKKREQAAALQEAARSLEYPAAAATDEAVVAFMEKLVGLGKEQLVKSTLIAASMDHMKRIAPDWAGRFEAALSAQGGDISPERLVAVHDVYTQYLTEHYLSHEGEEHHTGHAAFSPDLLNALEWAYGVPKEMGKHVFTQTRQAVEELAESKGNFSGERMAVTMAPAQGLLRIYAGDIGDACYTSQHELLAKGAAPDLHAVVFVTNRGTAQERLNGSVLFVETRTPKGENVLLVRANNPRENLISQVDADELVKQSIDAAIKTAEERGLDIVVVPLDGASQSSSNRPAVANYYAKHYAKAEKIELVDEAETNFNGYNSWDPTKGHPAVAVWRRGKK